MPNLFSCRLFPEKLKCADDTSFNQGSFFFSVFCPNKQNKNRKSKILILFFSPRLKLCSFIRIDIHSNLNMCLFKLITYIYIFSYPFSILYRSSFFFFLLFLSIFYFFFFSFFFLGGKTTFLIKRI